MRRDLQPLRPGDDIAVELRILTSRRTDLVTDRTRAINRLRAQLLEYFPALERAFDYSASKAALILLSGYQTPDGLRHAGAARLAAWLRKRKARKADAVAAAAIEAAKSQHTVIPGQQLAAAMVARLAEEVMTLDTEIGDTDAMIEERFRRHRHAEIILSMPGFGVILGAEFLAATGGDIAAFGNTDRLAAVAGVDDRAYHRPLTEPDEAGLQHIQGLRPQSPRRGRHEDQAGDVLRVSPRNTEGERAAERVPDENRRSEFERGQ
jgi:transposase